MADNFNITPGSGAVVLADEVTDATLGTGGVQYVKEMDGTIASTNKSLITSGGAKAMAIASDAVTAAGVALTPKWALSNASANTTTQIVAAVGGKHIRVLALDFSCGSTATAVTFKSATTAITPTYNLSTYGGEVLPANPYGWFQTAVAEALNVTAGAGSTVAVLITYVEVA